MNVSEYIASGILESYVMGAVSDQERREVECLSSIYPDIRHELSQLSVALENYVMLHSVEPPDAVKTKLLDQLEFAEPDVRQTIVRPMPVDIPSGGHTYRMTWIVAASVALLLLVFSFFLLSQLRSNQKVLASTRSINESLQTQLRQLREREIHDEQRLAVLQRAGMRVIQLKGNEKAPTSNLFVYWNTQTKQVSVDIKSLPALPSDRQYQLWSLVSGKAVDAGVFEADTITQPLQLLNRTITQADAFAITVEKRGGSPTPNLATLLAMTPVKS